MAYTSFEDLDVWKESCRLSVSVHELFLDSKCYAMRDQILRSSISNPSNIAEGAERGTVKDYIRFLHYAKGSSAELRTQLYLSAKMNLISADDAKNLAQSATKISKQLQALIKALEKRIPKT